jgi:polygalacturonase
MIDIDGCHDVRISDCIGDADDDGITLKSTSGRANENVVITNCILSSHCNALKMGTESNTGFKNIAVSNIVIRPSKISEKAINGRPNGNAGIALEMVDGGVLDGVVISNIWIDGPNCPLFIRLGNRARPYYQGQKIEKVGVLQNVSINNVIAVNAKMTGCSITGVPGNPVRNINLSNVSIEFDGGGTIEDSKRAIPEKEKSYPESDMFDILPSYGFFIRHAQNVTFNNVQLKTRSNDLRPAICLDDVQNSEFKDIKIGSQKENQCNFMLTKTSGILISGCKIQGASNSFLDLKGEENTEIFVINNLLTNVSSLITKDSKNKNAVREVNNVK